MSKYFDYENINQSFEVAVIKLQDNLQYLANQGNVSDRFITMQNSIIKALINYQHQTEKLIGNLEWEIIELAKGKVSEIERLKIAQESLQAICIIHGITDFPMWIKKGNKYLIHQAITDYKENIITIPYLFQEKFNRLPKQKKELLNIALYQSYEDEITGLKMRIQELKSNKNDTTT